MVKLPAMLLSAVLLVGCAATQLDANVHTQGAWPAGRVPGTYAFQRLPSQQADDKEQDKAEAEARAALEAAGFQRAAAAPPDVLVQLAKRTGQVAGYYPGGGPVFGPYWSGGFYGGGWRGGGWGYGAGWGASAFNSLPYYVNEVAVLILDARSQAALYESRAQSDGSGADRQTWAALFQAALKDFPYNAVSPRQVAVRLAPADAAASAPK